MTNQKLYPIEFKIQFTKKQYDKVNEMIDFLGVKNFFELSKKALSYYYSINSRIYDGGYFYFDNNEEDKFIIGSIDKLWGDEDKKIIEFKINYEPDPIQMTRITFLLKIKELDLTEIMFEALILLDYLIDQNKKGKSKMNFIEDNRSYVLNLPNKGMGRKMVKKITKNFQLRR